MKKTKRIAFLSLVLAVLMVASVLPLGMLTASAAVTATPNWYTNETSDATPGVLYVDDAADLWAFAEQLQGGTNFAGQTIKLTADIEVNEGMDIYGGYVTNAQKWPLTTYNKKFAGTFDGQGHTISGLYVTGTGEGVGIFGNVGTGTKATVKNVNIVNSYVTSNTAGVGGIFGEVDNETTTTVYDDSHINATKATVSGVYAKINVVCTSTTDKTDLGTGGIIGGARSDVEITNTTFEGKVDGGVRGSAAFVGAVRPYRLSGTYTYYYRNYITIKNCVANATVSCTNAQASMVGALVGYTDAITTHTFENVFSTCTVSGNSEATNVGIGTLIGGSYWSTTHYKNRNGGEDWQEFFFNNVHYQTISGVSNVIGKTSNAQKNCNTEHYAHATKAGVVDAIVESVEDSLQQSLTLKSNLSLNVYAMILDPDAVVTIGGVQVSGDAGRYTLDGILPQQMTETFSLKITQTILGEKVVIQKALSIRKYCEIFWDADFTTEAEKDLIADLLRYGEAAQLREDYKTAFLATSDMDLRGYGSEVVVDDIQTKYEKTQNSSEYMFTSAALSLDNTLGLRLMFTAADTAGLSVSVSVHGSKTQTFTAEDFIRWGSSYVVDYHKIYAHQMEAPVTAKLLRNGSAVATLTYSVADYCKAFLADETQSDYALVKAMFAYGMSATAYNDANRLVIIDGGESDYVIVYDDANETYKEMAWAFARELRAKTGVMLPVVDDTTTNTAKEIIIGKANGRSETTTVYNMLTSYTNVQSDTRTVTNKKCGSRATIVGTDIVVVAETLTYTDTDTDGGGTVNKTPELLQEAVDDLLNEIRTHGGDTWSIGDDYSAQIDLPNFGTSDSKKVYYAGENNHTLSITGTSLNYNTYVQALKNNGFVEYTTNEINGNLFGTYIKTEGGSDMVAYTAYYPGGSGYYTDSKTVFDVKTTNGTITDNVTTQNLRITYGPLTFLPGTEEITASDAIVRAVPFIMQNARWSAYAESPGMCYVVQLLDGSFILIDGGYGTSSKYKAQIYTEPSEGTVSKPVEKDYDDSLSLYNLLVEMSPDEKPVVAAWFISHTHQDHVALSNDFMARFYDQVDIKMFAHNYPDEIACRRTNANNAYNIDNAAATFNANVAKYYPNAQRWIVHTGQKLYLPGCDIEIFYTPEDFYGIYDNYTMNGYSKGYCWFANGNETSIMFRITVGGTSFMVTGDSEDEICTQVGTRYRDTLESDILQTPHHGGNGPELGFYEYVDPKIVLWSIDEFRFENNAICNGYRALEANKIAEGYLYTYTSSTTKATKGYGPGNSNGENYYANWWLKTSNWTRSDGTSGARDIYAVSSTNHTKIECSIPAGFKWYDPVIETPLIPLW